MLSALALLCESRFSSNDKIMSICRICISKILGLCQHVLWLGRGVRAFSHQLWHCWVSPWYFWYRTCLSIVWNHTPFPVWLCRDTPLDSLSLMWLPPHHRAFVLSSCSVTSNLVVFRYCVMVVFFTLLTKGQKTNVYAFHLKTNAEGTVLSCRDHSYDVNLIYLLFSSFYLIIDNMKTLLLALHTMP